MSEHDGDLVTALEKADLFAGFERAELELLAGVARRRHRALGELIFALGEDAREVYVIESGRVELKLPLSATGETEVTVDEKEAGAVFAWSALVPPHKLMLAAYAATDVQLVAFERNALNQLLGDHATIQIRLLSNLNRVIAGRVAMLEAVLVRNLQRWLPES